MYFKNNGNFRVTTSCCKLNFTMLSFQHGSGLFPHSDFLVILLFAFGMSKYPCLGPCSRLPIVTFPAQVVAAKQLEESKTKIENLLDWLANVDRDSGRAAMEPKQIIEQNGTHFQEGDSKSMMGEEDEFNGNLLDTDVDGHVGTTEENLNQQYQKMKVRCFKHDIVRVSFGVYKARKNLA